MRPTSRRIEAPPVYLKKDSFPLDRTHKRLGRCRSRADFCPTGKLKLPILVIWLPNEVDVPDCAMIVISRWRH